MTLPDLQGHAAHAPAGDLLVAGQATLGRDDATSNITYATFGVAAVALGYSAFPIPAGCKKTHWQGWCRWCSRLPSADELAKWRTNCPDWSVAIACGAGLFAIDIDEGEAYRAELLQNMAFAILGVTPLVRIGSAPRRILLYRSTDEVVTSSRWPHADLLGHGRYFVASGIHPVTHGPYEWVGPSPSTTAISTVPVVDMADLDRFRRVLDAFYGKLPDPVPLAPETQASARDTRIRPVNAGPWTFGADGLVIDGRDSFLAMLVWQATMGTTRTTDAAATAWSEFTKRAELTRNARDGQRRWAMKDAVAKAQSLAASGKVRRRISGQEQHEHGFWTEPTKHAFDLIVTKLGAMGQLSPATVKMSTIMLGLVHGDGTCFASAETLAKELDLSIDTIKKGRRTLRAKRLWQSSLSQGGQGYIARYRPDPAALALDLNWPVKKTVDAIPTMIFQAGGVETWGDLLLSKE